MARYLAGEMNPNEELAFQQKTDTGNMERIWKIMDQKSTEKHRDSGPAWEKLHQRLHKEGLVDEEKVLSPGIPFRSGLRIAASILLILALGIPALWFGVLKERGPAQAWESRSAETGISSVDLSDGSRVILNQGSKLRYAADIREVILEGEGFFEVMADPEHPFLVHSGKALITVLGTSFNVKETQSGQEVEVLVETGIVRVSGQESGQSITLEPGEFGIVETGAVRNFDQTDPNYMSWKTKEFKFVDTELLSVLKELEESYHVKIDASEAGLEGLKITTSYHEQTIDAILETIGAAFNISISRTEDGYRLSR